MERINIEEILRKHSPFLADCLKQANGEGSKLQSAIKEIIEAVVDKCAEKATTGVFTKGISKQSILQVKTLIDYE